MTAIVQLEGAIQVPQPLPATQQNLIGQFTLPQTLERTAQQVPAYSKQLPGIAVERLDAAAFIQHHKAFVEHFQHGLLFFQQRLERHLPRDRFSRCLNGAQGMKVKPAWLCGQRQHRQGAAQAIPDGCGGAMHAPLAQAKPEILFGQHVHQPVFGQRQPRAVGALHRFQQPAAHGREVQAAKIQGRAVSVREVDMTPGVVGQQSTHDLRRRRDQHTIGGQRRGELIRGDKPVVAVGRVDAGADAALP